MSVEDKGDQDRAQEPWFTFKVETGKPPQSALRLFPFEPVEAMRSGIFISGTRQCGKTTLALHLTNTLKALGIIVYVIDPTRVWMTRRNDMQVLSIPPPTKQMEQLTWKFQNTIFDTSMLGVEDQQRFTEVFCKATLDRMIQLPQQMGYGPQIWIWFEEAHTPMPNHVFHSKRLMETKRLITQGANFNIGFGAITQFASMVDKLPVKCAQQRYFGRTSEPNDLEYLKAFLGKKVNELIDLKTGEFLYSYGNKTERITIPPFS